MANGEYSPVQRAGIRAFQMGFAVGMRLLPWRMAELVEGPGAVKILPMLLKREGVCRPLVVTGPHLYASGLTGRALAALEEEGMEYAVFHQVPADPTVHVVEEILAAWKSEGCDSFVAIGGGSPMDAAKAAAALAVRPGRTVEQLGGLLKVRRHLPTFIAVPTTAGTGSETTIAAVVSDDATGRKYALMDLCLMPRYAVLDPELTLGLPARITAATGMDALTHGVEAYLCRYYHTPATRRWAEEAVGTIFAHLEAVCRNGEDVEGRMALLKASCRAGAAFTRTGVGNVHAIAHTIGGLYHVPHGAACAAVLPVVLEDYGPAAHEKLARLADVVGLPGKGSAAERAAALIRAIRELNARLGLADGFDCIREEDIPQMARWACREANPVYPVPVLYGTDRFERVIRQLKQDKEG